MNVFPSNADGSELLAVTESVKGTYRMDTTTLATKAQEKYTDNVKGDLNTAHPKVQPNGDTINIVVGFGKAFRICSDTLTHSTTCSSSLLNALLFAVMNVL